MKTPVRILALFAFSLSILSVNALATDHPAWKSGGGGRPMTVDCEKISKPRSKTFYEDNKTLTDPVDDSASWTFADPAQVGLNKAVLDEAAAVLAKKKNIWSFLVIRDGALAYEKYFNGSSKRASNNVHSASKSMLSAAIGVALDQGVFRSTDEKVSTFLPWDGKKDLRLRHLLTMSAGLRWTEDSTEYQIEKKSHWLKAILGLAQEHAPGAAFKYNTGLTHTMSGLLTEASGMSTCAFMHKNIFSKIGVTAERWGRDPQGYFSGGYNLYLTARELAKFGMLYLNGGQWKGQQVVPTEWVQASMTKQMNARAGFDYGYNWWLRNVGGRDVAWAWGYGGQYAYVVKDLNLVMVVTTNTKDFEIEYDAEPILRDYVMRAALR